MLDELAFGRNGANPGDGIGDGHAPNLVVLVADHVAELAFRHQLDGAYPEARAEDPVEGGGIAAPLKVTQHHVTGFLAGALFHFPGHMFAHASQTNLSLAAESGFNGGDPTLGGHGSFRDHDHGGGQTQGSPLLGEFGHLGKVKGDFGNEDGIGTSGQTSVKGDPTGVTAHGFYHHDPLVGTGGGVEPVEAVDHAGDGRVKTEGGGGGEDVVVDRLGNSHDIDACFLELKRSGERTVAADADEGVEIQAPAGVAGLVENFPGNFRFFTGTNLGHETATIRGTENGSPQVADVRHGDRVEALVTDGIEQAFITVQKTQHLIATGGGRRDDPMEHGIESGTVATAG